MIRIAVAVGLVVFAASNSNAQAPERRAASPAAVPVPESSTQQTFAPSLIESGRVLFASQCGFCHGLDTAGASGGPDLTRSAMVAEDIGGNLIAAVVRSGRIDAEVPMPAFPELSADEVAGLVAYIHDQKSRAESAEGGRRAVSAEDVQSGDVRAGQRFFDANCAECHSPERDLRGIASRIDGLALMRRMLNPRAGGRPSERATPRVRVQTSNGDSVVGLLAYQDEFTIALTDADGRYRSFNPRNVSFEIDDPLERHVELLGEYTDEQMHDVLTFLHTLR